MHQAAVLMEVCIKILERLATTLMQPTGRPGLTHSSLRFSFPAKMQLHHSWTTAICLSSHFFALFASSMCPLFYKVARKVENRRLLQGRKPSMCDPQTQEGLTSSTDVERSICFRVVNPSQKSTIDILHCQVRHVHPVLISFSRQ